MATLLEVMLIVLIIFVITIPVIEHTVKIGLPRASNQPRSSSRSLNWTEVFNQETPSSYSWLAPSPWHAAWQIDRLNPQPLTGRSASGGWMAARRPARSLVIRDDCLKLAGAAVPNRPDAAEQHIHWNCVRSCCHSSQARVGSTSL